MNNKEYKPLHYLDIRYLTNFPYIEATFDALTDYELISKIGGEVNKVIYNQKILDENNKEIVKEVNELKDYVDEYLVDIEDVKADIVELKSAVLTNANNINALKNYTDNLVNNNYNILKTYIDNAVLELNNRIDNIEIGEINVYDPTTGILSPLQVVINNLYQSGNENGITATDFDALELTATNFDNKQITALDFDKDGAELLV